MRRLSPTSRTGRAILGAIAIYALLLQAFLASASFAGPLRDPGVICAAHGGEAEGVPSGVPVRHDHQCCTAAALTQFAPPPSPAASVVTWRPYGDAPSSWRAALPPPARGPPLDAHGPRGPPTV